MKYLFKFTSLIAIIFSFAEVAYAEESYMCIWRNPERTMVRIFPDAMDYKTITKKITSQNLKKIEDRAGKLLSGQREVFQYYELIGEGTLLGYIFASTQKGEYGAIEFVFGLDKESKITAIYIQRSRERDRKFKQKEFEKYIGINQKEEITTESGQALTIADISKRKANEQSQELKAEDYAFFSRHNLLLPIIEKLKQQASIAQAMQLVEINGNVTYPGIYPLTVSGEVADLVTAAGGLLESA